MWNFLEFLWVLAGGFSVYILLQDLFKKGNTLTIKDVAVLVCAFFGGIVTLIYLIVNEGDSIVVFKKPDPAQPTAAYVNPDPVAKSQPAAAPVSKSENKQRSVLDG